MSQITEVVVDPKIIERILPRAQFSDSFRKTLNDQSMSLEEAARKSLENTPMWVEKLLALRNFIVKPFGLKSEPKEADRMADEKNFYGFFPLVSKNEDEIVLGFDDKHLDFRIRIYFQIEEGKKALCLATIVKTHNLFGRVYLKTIMPFHRVIAPTALKNI